jgi:para-aminobenzoate synthetase component 1
MTLFDTLLKEITVEDVYSETLDLDEPFLEWAGRFATLPGTILLMSGGNLDCARYHILGAKPWLTFSGQRRRMCVTTENQTYRWQGDPLEAIDRLLRNWRLKNAKLPPPIAAGFLGYLAYDLKDTLENLPKTVIDDLDLPHIYFNAPTILVVHDKQDGITRLNIPLRKHAGQTFLDHDLARAKSIIAAGAPAASEYNGNPAGLRSNFTRADYLTAVKKIKTYIRTGHVYQVNMSQRFESDFCGDPFALFKTLYRRNPAPFFAYIHAAGHRIISTSPERFIKQTNKLVESRPIKGTRPRGKTPAEDRRLRRDLQESKKDDAELSMIVDLLRNDLGKVCVGGSVRVAQHKRLEAYQNVYHLVSIVEGTLAANQNAIDLIRATFPGGSITGCPKIRAMEIIDELESHRRHIYTGSIGYISFHDTMDLSIAIRTATVTGGHIYFSVGGGIVYDSDPADEFEETLHKGQTLMTAFSGQAPEVSPEAYIWLNGSLKPQNDAGLPVSDQGVLYGYGFFETLRVKKGIPMLLDEHLARFNHTWHCLFGDQTPDLSWDVIIRQVVAANRLENTTAAVKIVATMGSQNGPPDRHNLIVMARPYRHRLQALKTNGLHLAVYPEPRQSPLADHKTLNYLYYLLAGNWAGDRQADEALILNPDGTISETNTANLLVIKKNTAMVPQSAHVLPGIMQAVVCKLLSDWGYATRRKRLRLEALFAADQVILTNSLIGAVPVLTIDGNRLLPPSNLCSKINQVVL